MSMMTAKSEPVSVTAPAVESRSPFVRLTELIAGIEPGKPVINLSVGEPQHPVPSFVGPTLAAHIADFGRYPANKGIEPFRHAVAAWLKNPYKLARPVDPETEVLVLNGTREGLFLGAIAATRWVTPRAGKPAVLIPNPFYAAYSAGALAAGCEPVYLPATRATGFLPDLGALDDTLLARTVACYIASPSNPQGAVADRKYLDRLVKLARRFGFLVFADECYCENTTRMPRPACSRRRLPISQMSWCFTRYPNARICPACASDFRLVIGDFSVPIWSCATSRHRRCRHPPNMSRLPPTKMKCM